ncbi:MAG: hypothetical protein ACQGVK_08775 [Myxococcota bacterium]
MSRAGLVLGLLLGVPLWAGCAPQFEILAPISGATLPENGELQLSIDFGDPLPAGTQVDIWVLGFTAQGEPTSTDWTDLLEPPGGFDGVASVDATLGPADGIAPGQNILSVRVQRPGGDVELDTRLVVWAHGIDLDAIAASHPDRCDPIEPINCLYPFPNDLFTRPDPATDTGLRIAIERDSMPANISGVRVDPTEHNRSDGFSPGAMILTHLPGIDLAQTGAPSIDRLAASLDADSPFALVDAETAERQLFWAELDSAARPVGSESLILRPGKNLANGRRYVVGIARARDAAGDLLEAPPGFRLYRDGIKTLIPEIETRRPAMERIFSTLERAGMDRSELVQAWEFTVVSKRSMGERLIHIRDDAFASLGADAPSFTVTEIEDDFNANTLRRVSGTFEVPLYLDNDGLPGARLLYDVPASEAVDHLPIRAGGGTATYTANFRCVVPRSASADGTTVLEPARASLYGHGLLGSAGETGSSHVRDMAFAHNFVFCGTDSIGMAEDDFETPPGGTAGWILFILNDISRFPTLPDRLHQGILNTLFLGRLMIHPDGLSSDPAFRGSEDGQPFIDGSHLFYDGNSQGGILGGAIAAVATDLERAVLGVPGMNYSTLLRRSVDFDPFLLLLEINYPQRTHSLLIALMQMLWDRAETNGHANHLTHDPYPGTPPKEVLLHVAWGDYQVANVTAEVEARTIGASIHRPAIEPESRHWEDDPFYGIPEISYPHDGSALVYWDSGNLTPPNGNTPPRDGGPNLGPCAAGRGGDPHECPRREPAARLQKSEFLRQDVDEDGDGIPDRDGWVIDACGGQACVAP